MTSKRALITGITGQDGSYLADFLIKNNYEVHGLRRRTSLFNTDRIDHLYQNIHEEDVKLILHHGDMTDSSSLIRIIKDSKPDEIYNLAAQSHVGVSFEEPEYTANSDALGALRILESIKILGLENQTKFYQASTSELYGMVRETPQNEDTPFYPRSPYAVAKLYAYWITINYRESYGIHASNGILFNHESPVRGETFVTRKITRALSRIKLGLQSTLYLGNIDAKRDWGHAKDFVEAQWEIVQQKNPDDYVIATGHQYSVREFIETAAKEIDMKIKWEGKGMDEICIWDCDGKEKPIIKIDKRYFRPAEVDSLLGDASKAKKVLGWSPKITFKELVSEMINYDLELTKKDKLAIDHGYNINKNNE